jgi:nicotinate-nucleotide adenylyltransferase
MGMDAFAHLTTWSSWQRLRELAHIAVLTRPDGSVVQDRLLRQWLSEWSQQRTQEIDSRKIIERQAAGGFMCLEQSLLPISSTQVRQQLYQEGTSVDVPPAVAEYIDEHDLYQQN